MFICEKVYHDSKAHFLTNRCYTFTPTFVKGCGGFSQDFQFWKLLDLSSLWLSAGRTVCFMFPMKRGVTKCAGTAFDCFAPGMRGCSRACLVPITC